MTNATVAATVLTDLVQGASNEWAETFDSTRAVIRHGSPSLVKDGLGVAKHLVGDRLATVRAPDVSELHAGEGAIAQINGHTVAAYRDADDVLHTVSATCTHLGCTVAFNTAERTWDCPCHGSRFDITGRVLEGPAITDLSRAD